MHNYDFWRGWNTQSLGGQRCRALTSDFTVAQSLVRSAGLFCKEEIRHPLPARAGTGTGRGAGLPFRGMPGGTGHGWWQMAQPRNMPGKSSAILLLIFSEPDLLGLEARGGFPIERLVHHLTHPVKPPVGAVQTLFTLHSARAPVRSRQTQFQLFLIHHTIDLSFLRVQVWQGGLDIGCPCEK